MRRAIKARSFSARWWSFRAGPLPYFALKGRQCAFDDFAERRTVHDFPALVAKAFSLDDLVKTVVRPLRDACIEKDGPP